MIQNEKNHKKVKRKWRKEEGGMEGIPVSQSSTRLVKIFNSGHESNL